MLTLNLGVYPDYRFVKSMHSKRTSGPLFCLVQTAFTSQSLICKGKSAITLLLRHPYVACSTGSELLGMQFSQSFDF